MFDTFISKFSMEELEKKNPPYVLHCDKCGRRIENTAYALFDYYYDYDRLNCEEPLYLYSFLCEDCGTEMVDKKLYYPANEGKVFNSIDNFLDCYWKKIGG